MSTDAAAPSVPAADSVARSESGSPLAAGNLGFARALARTEPCGPAPAPTEEDLKWAAEHQPKLSPEQKEQEDEQQQSGTKLPGTVMTPTLTHARIQRRSGVNPLEGLLGPDAVPALSEDELQQIEDEHTFTYSRSIVCNAPRSLLWRHLMKKIRQPELYTNARTCKILCEGPDFVYRDMLVGPEHCTNPDALVQVRDKVTWSEEEEEVRFALYEDEVKEGYIDNAITLDASSQVCLTCSCRWTFHPSVSMTSELLQRWKERLRASLDAGTTKTVRVVEEEARQIEKERRRRHSLTNAAEQELQQKELALKQSAAAAAAAPQNAGAVDNQQTILVAAKPEQKAQ